jgi:hypothetical protein
MTRLLCSFDVGWLRSRALLRGAASVLDLRGDTRRQYRWPVSDADAPRDDWAQVTADLRSALDAG